jgi:hypothetical protein
MNLAAFTLFHVILSLLGIGSGLIVFYGLLTAKRFDTWSSLFLWTTLATSVTGFMFPFKEFLPSHAFGIISILLLAAAFPARYRYRLEGGWGRIYAVTSLIALYLNVFVLIVQSFLKIPILHAMAPTQSEPPFLIAQLVNLIIFSVLGVRAVSGLRRQPLSAA